MFGSPRAFLSQSGAVIAAVCALFSAILHGLAAGPIPSNARTAIVILAEYAAPVIDNTQKYLEAAGYTPDRLPVERSFWDGLSSYQKFASLYLIAEANHEADNKASSGKDVLAAVFGEIRKDYGGIVLEPALRDYFLGAVAAKGVHFSRGPPQSSTWFKLHSSIPPEARAAIRELAAYTAQSPFGDEITLLQKWFGLTEQSAHQIALEGRSWNERLESALAKSLGGEKFTQAQACAERLRGAIEEVRSRYDAANYEPAFTEILKAAHGKQQAQTVSRLGDAPSSGEPSSGGPSSGGPSSGGPSSGFGTKKASTGRSEIPIQRTVKAPRTSGSAATYANYVQRTYPTRQARAFRAVVGRALGWGGVVFGNDVKPSFILRLLFPSKVSFEPYAGGTTSNEETGDLVIKCFLAPRLTLPNVKKEHVDIASEILFTSYDDRDEMFTSSARGDAIGLISLMTQINEPAIHPAIMERTLCTNLILTDQLLVKGSADTSWPELRGGDLRPVTWKVTDRPVDVSIGGKRLLRVQAAGLVGRADPRQKSTLLDVRFWGYTKAEMDEFDRKVESYTNRINVLRERQDKYNREVRQRSVKRKNPFAEAGKGVGMNQGEILSMLELSWLATTRSELESEAESLNVEAKVLAAFIPNAPSLESLAENWNREAPLLVATQDHFRAANDFARVLAVMRWIKYQRSAMPWALTIVAASTVMGVWITLWRCKKVLKKRESLAASAMVVPLPNP